jgi:hypothetical protein
MSADTMHANAAPAIAYSIPEAVRASGLSRSAIYLALRNGALGGRKAGSRTVIERHELERYIAGLPPFAPRAA